MKECIICKETKSLEDFYGNIKMIDGHLNKCKKCCKKQSTERYKEKFKNREKRPKAQMTDTHRNNLRMAKIGDKNPMKNHITSKKVSASLKGKYFGPNHPCFTGNNPHYRGYDWTVNKVKRKEIDNYTCQMCGIRQTDCRKSLHVHHIIDFAKGGSNDLSNLITLCPSCHGTQKKGDNAPSLKAAKKTAKLNPSQVLQVRDLLNTELSQKKISSMFNVSQRVISKINVGKGYYSTI